MSSQDSPLRHVDYEKDRIVEAPISIDMDSIFKLNTQLENCVEKYLAAFKKHSKYMGKWIGDLSDPGAWIDRRSNLAAQLLRDVKKLREASEEERDWDMNVEETYMCCHLMCP